MIIDNKVISDILVSSTNNIAYFMMDVLDYQDRFRIYLDEYEEPEKIKPGCSSTEFNIG